MQLPGQEFSDCISSLVNQHQTSDAQQANVTVNSMLLQLDLSPTSLTSRRGHRKCRGVLRCLPNLSKQSAEDRFREETVLLQYFWCFLLFLINTLPPFSALTPGL